MSASRIVLLTLFYLGLFVTSALAQQVDPANLEFSKRTSDGRYSFIKFKKSGTKTDTSATRVKQLLGLGNRHTLLFDNNSKLPADLKDGQMRHSRYQQYFSGLKVEFSHLTLHSRSGVLEILSGDYYTIPETFSTTPSLTESTAFSKALSFVGATRYSWEQGNFPTKALNERPTGELVVCKDFIGERNNPLAPINVRLAYKFKIYAVQPLKYDAIYVDASDGRILLVDPIIKHADGIAETKYSGTRTITTSANATGQFTLKDTSGNNNVATWDLKKGDDYFNASEFKDNDNNWTSQEYNNVNLDNAALDAHWGAMKTSEYFKLKHNRNSFDNNGARINSYVHFGTNYVNAFWDGISMTYGDGNGVSHLPLTTLDICGHEIAHAVCQYSAGLIYFGESGAINESLSDIWGACVEYFADPQKSTWLLGDECSTTGTPFRSMSNPNSQGHPDTYKGTLWYTGFGDNGGVHYNSGVMNFWFYILSVGHSGVNDFGLSYNISGISIDKAAAIVYRAETVYLFPSATYTDARMATLQSAQDLYGVNSNEFQQAKRAWDAVGVAEVLAAPTEFTGTANGSSSIQLSWNYNYTNEISGFVLERSINDTSNFQTLATVGPASRSYGDLNIVNNSFNNYRIRAVRGDSVFSKFLIARVPVGNAPLIMTPGVFTSCGINFFDPGGSGNYPNSSDILMTLKPATSGTKVRVRFNSLRLEQNVDYLLAYNGSNTNEFITSFTGNWKSDFVQSTAPNGELTLRFQSNSINSDSGWSAFVSCYKPIQPVTGLTASFLAQAGISLQWTDILPDETKFVIERSINDSLNFQVLRELPANTVNFIDSSLPASAVAYYRVLAYWDNLGSNFSNTVGAVNGPVVLMQNGEITTCEGLFMDAGGLDYNYAPTTQTLTLRSAQAGKKIKLSFVELKMSNCCEFLKIYNGPSTSSPLMGSFNGTTPPPEMESTSAGGELTMQYSGSTHSDGWKAIISCYIPVAGPNGLGVTLVNDKPMLQWLDHSNDETRFVIERSVNAPNRFEVVGEVAADVLTYTDNSAPLNSLCIYRVRAYRENQGSPYSGVVSIGVGNAPFLMADSIMITCDKVFMDEGGLDVFNESNVTKTVTFKPSLSRNRVRVEFSSFKVSYNFLYVYNGSSVNAPLIGAYNYSNIPRMFEGSNAEGSLTFSFVKLTNVRDSGWVAKVSCYKPVDRPTNLQIVINASQMPNLTWVDNADDETNYVIERSINAPSLYLPIATVAANVNSYADSSAPVNSVLFYRIKAQRDTFNSQYSDPKQINVANAPFLMKDSVLTVCDKYFMDAGGVDVYPPDYSYRIATFKPSVPGNRIKIDFLMFKTNAILQLFNGSVAYSSPSLGSFSGTSIPRTFYATGPEGSITVLFQNTSSSDSGWLAYVSCYKPVPKPTGLQSTPVGISKIQLQWNDNANDETGYVVERSVNASTLYLPIATLPANTNQFSDSLAPANSVLFYRVIASRDSINSFYSDTSIALLGNAPLIMKDTVAIVCGKQFMDPGGVDVVPKMYKSYTATLKPNDVNSRVRVEFQMFKIGYYSSVRVYNGATANAPLLASASYGSVLPTVLEGVNPEGALTFIYASSNELDSGWLANVICYKTVSRPTKSSAVDFGNRKVKISWQDNSNDETRFVIERSENGVGRFNSVGQVGANNQEYVDTTAPENNMLYYRIKAYRDTLPSFSSDTTELTYGDAPFLMSDSTLMVCNRKFYDAGGLDRYPVYFSKKTTFKPSVAGNRLKISFTKARYFGSIEIFDGPSTGSRSMGTFSPINLPSSITATNPEGALTMIHYAYNNIDSGWEAQITCFKPVAKPTSMVAFPSSSRVNLQWQDNSDDETKYVVERSINSPYLYTTLAELPANSNNFIDSSLTDNNLAYYRVKALRDTLSSFYSDTASYENGNGPIIMNDNAVVVCDKVFLDPGGKSIIRAGDYDKWTTFKPGRPNHRIKVVFTSFKVGYGNGLNILNGPYTNSPFIGNYTDQSPPGTVVSTATDGSLSFRFYQRSNISDSGWVANVYCEEIIYAPSELRAIRLGENKAKLTWLDGSSNEQGFSVERSSDGIHFSFLTNVVSNSTLYTDSTDGSQPYLYYRVRAFNGDSSSFFSNIAAVSIKNDTVVMRDGDFSGCNLTFMDPGGTGLYQNNQNYMTRFFPSDRNSRIKISFKSLKLAVDGNDRVLFYLGNSDIPFKTYYANSPLETFVSGEAEGFVGFRFISNSSSVDSGWVVDISCVPFPSPTNLQGTVLNDGKIKLKWTKSDSVPMLYELERSVGSPTRFRLCLGSISPSVDSIIDNNPAINAVNYYRIRAIYPGYKYSAYSNIISTNPNRCSTTTGISSQTYRGVHDVYGTTQLMDTSCKLIAEIKPSESVGPKQFTLSSFIWRIPTASTVNSQTFLRKRFEFSSLDEIAPEGKISFFLDQSDFEDFNQKEVYPKLPTSPTDWQNIKNLRVWVFRSYSTDQSGAPESFYGNPLELDSSKVRLYWNYQYNCWQVTIDSRIHGGFFITTAMDSTNICSSSNPSFTNNLWIAKAGTNFQWQRHTGAGFVNLNGDANHTGQTTQLLKINNQFVGHGDLYRCVVDGIPMKPIQINKIGYWLGGNDGSWSNPNNWNCGVVPHSNAAIIVEAGKSYYPVISSNIICRALTIKSGAFVSVSSGYTIKIEK